MADTPRLPAPAETTAYAPYSFTAVLAVSLAVLFAVLLVVLGISSYFAGQSFVQPILLIIPVVVVVVAFAARRQIVASEGTRVGTHLCTLAWWIAVLGGAGYAAYLVAINVAIRNDAAGAFRSWAAVVATANPTDAKNTDLLLAFHGTLPPPNQAKIAPTDAKSLIGLYTGSFLHFRQCDLLRIASRNKGNVTFEIGALEDWVQEPTGLTCYLGGKLICPEGDFVLAVTMVRQSVLIRGELQPVWGVKLNPDPQAGFLRGARYTKYGELVRHIETSGFRLAYNAFVPLASVPLNAMHPLLFPTFAKANATEHGPYREIENVMMPRMAAFGAMSLVQPTVGEAEDAVANTYFAPLDPGDPKITEASQRSDFRRCWRTGRITIPGQMIPKNLDANSLMTFQDNSIELRVPVELQVEASRTAARGTMVLLCDDAGILAKVKELRADPGPPVELSAEPLGLPNIPWRIVRIESDMKSVALPKPGAEQ